MVDAVLDTAPLGAQWPTLDPFLFCAHHNDSYPRANSAYGPAESLRGREIGSDFAGKDGWNMYHGTTVPGFPAHPHRGFETVTYVRKGVIDHSDSLGATARFGAGDAQWVTAGRGIVHSEMFPLLDSDAPNPLELFQIWLNLPAADKMVDPYFTMLWAADLATRKFGSQMSSVTVTAIAGAIGDAIPPAPPPNSWASHRDADVAIWHLVFEPGATWTLPAPQSAATVRTLYCFVGPGLDINGTGIGSSTAGVLAPGIPICLTAGLSDRVECLLLQGRPIGEPVARYGPFVMNDREGVERAFSDYRRDGFGGWKWRTQDPVHGPDPTRFAHQ